VTWSKSIRQLHRWLSIIFTVTVILSAVAVGGLLPFWVVYTPLPLLALQLLTGLYLFALPYVSKWRGGRRLARGASA
jgi:hypothetical protein